MSIITNPSLDDHRRALADYLPNDRLFDSKNRPTSNFYGVIKGLSGEFFNAQGYLTTLECDYLPDETELFIEEWERALGIPDGCFYGGGTTETRRRDIVTKLASLGVQTADDFVALGATFGIFVSVAGLTNGYTVFFTGGFSTSYPPYSIPYSLPLFDTDTLICLFQKLIPANCKMIVS